MNQESIRSIMSKVPSGNYLVCLVSKPRMGKFLGRTLLELAFGGAFGSGGWPSSKINDYWILILGNHNLLHVSHLGMDDDPREFLEYYCDNLRSRNQNEIAELYFGVPSSLLRKEYEELLNLEPIETCLIPFL